MERLYGEEVITLSKVVKAFCLKQGNMKEQNVFQQLVYAQQVWKDLFRNCIWQVQNVVVEVDCEKNTIKLPEDCERLINISVIDRNHKLQPLTCDPGISTVEINCIKNKCSCDNCNGQNTLCGAVDSAITYTTEIITIQGSPYTQETWVRYSNGAIQQQQKIPSLNAQTNEVVYNTDITTICNVEVTDKGCIKPTDSNMELLRTYCGCDSFPQNRYGISYDWYRRNENLIPQPYNYYGYWNVNAADRNIIHIFRHDDGINRHHHEGSNGINKVIVSYQTNGEISGEEILIPQYAQAAIDFGIMWLQKAYNPRAGAGEKQFAKEQWRAEKMKVNKHLNPIRMEDIMKLQTQLRRW